MTDEEQIALAAYTLGQMDAALLFDKSEELATPLPGSIRQSFEGAQLFFANVLYDMEITDEAMNRTIKTSAPRKQSGVRKGLDAAIRDGFVSADYRDPQTLWLTIHSKVDITLEITREEAEVLLEGFDE